MARTRLTSQSIGFIEPMKALAVDHLPEGNWLLEAKFDGYRAIAILDKGHAELWSRNRKPLARKYPEIVSVVEKLACEDAILDGEVVILDAKGRSHFQLLQSLATWRSRLLPVYYAFDLLRLNREIFLHQPIETRKAALKKLLNRHENALRLSHAFPIAPAKFLRAARRQGLEGVVAKQSGSLYEAGRRSGAWVKYRFHIGQEFVIGGYTAPQGRRAHFGALLVGYYRGLKLIYASKVGTGFDDRKLGALFNRFQKIRRRKCPFAAVPLPFPELRSVQWLEPRLVCQIKFSEWTTEGSLRHPVFVGLRDDKPAREVVREASVR